MVLGLLETIQHLGTGPFWDKRMKSAEMDKIVREVQKKLNGKL